MFRFHFAVTVNVTLQKVLNLRWVAWVTLLHLRFLFIRLPSSRRCGLAETVGLCFRVDSNCATSVFVLGLVCVCLFCSVVVALFVVGWQQHCRYSVIDAMVYPRNWKSEDKFGTGKTLKCLDWVWYSYIWLRGFVFTTLYVMKSAMMELREFYFRFWTEEFRIWSIRHCAWVERDKFLMMEHHRIICFCFGRAMYSSLTTLVITDVIWTRDIF